MSGPKRLERITPHRFGTRIDRNEPVGFRFGGKAYAGLHGDTLTSALLACGVQSWTSSPRFRRPRGPMGLGLEVQTPVTLEGDGGLWATIAGDEIVAREGMVAKPAPLGLDGVMSRIPQGTTPDARTLPAPQRLMERVGRVLPLPTPKLPALAPPPPTRSETCDVLVIGSGLAGLAAATAAARAGLDVRVVEASFRAGGLSDLTDAKIDGLPAAEWAERRAGALRDRQALRLGATAISIEPDGSVTVIERADPLKPGAVTLRIISAKAIIVATGFRERPLPFADNDRPGVMLSLATRALLRRYAIAPGDRAVVATLSDDGYRTAMDLREAGVDVALVLDARPDPQGPAVEMAKALGVPVSLATVVSHASYDEREKRLVGVGVVNRFGEGVEAGARLITADALVVSGGFTPRDELLRGFGADEEHGLHVAFAGAGPADAVSGGWNAGVAAARRLGAQVDTAAPQVDASADEADEPVASLFERLPPGAGDRVFVDLSADVTYADVAAAMRAGASGPDVFSRKLGLGHGPDGGRLSADLPWQALRALTGDAAARPLSPGRPTLGLIAARAGLIGPAF